jgi:hypothetical protein
MHKKITDELPDGISLILHNMILTNEIIIAIKKRIHPNLEIFLSFFIEFPLSTKKIYNN